MVIESVQFEDVPLRVARPPGTPSSAVLVLHQASGWSAQNSAWLTRLAEHGHLAVAPMLLHRHGIVDVDPFARFGGDMVALAAFLPGDADILADVDTALRYVAAQDVAPSATGVLGFSYGGRAAYLVGSELALGASVSFYGVGIHQESFAGNDELPALTERADGLRTPWLGLSGEQDFLLSPGELDGWAKRLAAAPVATELVRYPDAGHAFDLEEAFWPGKPVPYVAEAAEDATARALQFLATSLR